MADTFESRLLLRQQESGSNSGNWGSLLNESVATIASAFGYGNEVLGSDADATITVANDGSSIDAARATFVKITSSATLSATRTITFAPLTLNQVKTIENSTTGGQSLIIKQGSGATVTIANGATKIVYFDGAGSGAAVTDALSGLELSAGLVTTSAIADDAVTAAKIADNAVDIARLNVSDGSAGQSLTTNGSGTLSFATIGGAFNDFAIKTANYTAVSKDQLIVNSSSAVTITLPASPSAGNVVFIKNAGTGTVTVARNGSNINSTADDGELAADAAASLVYVDATIGWEEL